LDSTKDRVLKNLRRIDGQIRGIESMISEGRSCSEILYQIVAAREALKRVGVEIAKQHICQRTSEGEDMEQEIEKIIKIIASLS